MPIARPEVAQTIRTFVAIDESQNIRKGVRIAMDQVELGGVFSEIVDGYRVALCKPSVLEHVLHLCGVAEVHHDVTHDGTSIPGSAR